jgi:hypothetical protein
MPRTKVVEELQFQLAVSAHVGISAMMDITTQVPPTAEVAAPAVRFGNDFAPRLPFRAVAERYSLARGHVRKFMKK